jgi:hypothetical protein
MFANVRMTAPGAFPRTSVFGSWTESTDAAAPLYQGFGNPLYLERGAITN